MNLRLRVLPILLAIQVVGGLALADEPAANYLLFAVTTPLQRKLFHSNADAYVQIDVGQCLNTGKFDRQRLGVAGLRRALLALARQVGVAQPKLQICYRNSYLIQDAGQVKAMEMAVMAIGREAGFVKFATTNSGEGTSWTDKVAKFAGLGDEQDPTESPAETEFARVYPVRTRLSRFLLGDPRVDCLIELRQAIDGRFNGFPPNVRQAIDECVAKLHLRQKRHLMFQCVATTEGQRVAEKYLWWVGSDSGAGVPAKELGFQWSGYLMNPMTVKPELLLRKPAPDFTLEALAGGQIHLREMLRGRVGVIAFWGVGCGACCEEAPYLTALYNQYRDKGLTVVAVNAYDESRQTVESFVRKKALTHPIAMKGGRVAAKYTVASFPVTFFVDRKGAIADYHLGFDDGDEKLLVKAVERLLAEGETSHDRN